MTQVAITGPGLMFPGTHISAADLNNATVLSLDAAGEAVAFIGHLYINGRPAAAKTISSLGGKIHFRTGTTTWSTAGTTVRVGIQDVDAVNGPPPRGDGTFDVYDDLVQGTDTITGSATNTATMSSGTKSLTHGDLIAVVLEMTVRNGADQVVIQGLGTVTAARPISVALTASWAVSNNAPMVVIEFDDGTLGCIAGGFPPAVAAAEAWQDSTNPDERGMIFQVPWDCKICGYWMQAAASGAAGGDFTLATYSDPTGTPAVLTGSSLAVLGEQLSSSTGILDMRFYLPDEVSLTRNTNYCFALKASGTSNITLRPFTIDATHRVFFSGGTTLAKAVRNDGAGAFTPTTTIFYSMGVIISSFEDTAGVGGGGILMPNKRGNKQ